MEFNGISVVICTYNRAQYLKDALMSLVNQTLDDHFFEVILVNNNSTDNTMEVALDFIKQYPIPAIRLAEEKKQGASHARNLGAALSKFDLLCFMDDDALAEPDYLTRILGFFKKNPQAGGLGGRIIPRYIPKEPKWMSYYVSSLVGNFDYSPEPCPFKEGKYPLESNMVVPKDIFVKIGGFNPKLPGVMGTLRIGGEGKDFFLKIQQLEKTIYYDPKIIVHHTIEVSKLTREYMYRVASGIGRGERVRMLSKGKEKFVLKGIEYLIKLGASYLLAIKYILQGHPSQALPVIRFRIDAIRGLLWDYNKKKQD